MCVHTEKLDIRMYVVKQVRVFEESYSYKCILHRAIPMLREITMTDNTKMEYCALLMVTARNSADA